MKIIKTYIILMLENGEISFIGKFTTKNHYLTILIKFYKNVNQIIVNLVTSLSIH